MYKVYHDDTLLYDPRMKDYALTDPILTFTANEPASLSFGVPTGNPGATAVTRLRGRVKVYRDQTLIFLGRVIEDTANLNHTRSYVVEDALAFLLDSIVRPFSFEGTVAEFFTYLLTNHASQVNEEQALRIGSCTVTSDVTLTVSSAEYTATWNVLKETLIEVYGGYLVLSFDANENPVLSYMTEPPDTATQRIVFGENLRDLALSKNADEAYTACIPLGATLKEIDENVDSEERLTIADANEGLDYLIDTANAALYGVIYAPVELTTFADAKNATYLLQLGRNWLSNSGTRIKESISLTAVDLHGVSADVEAFSFLDHVIVSCGDVCPETTFLLTGLQIPLSNPGSTSIVLGDTKPSLINDSAAAEADASKRIENIETDYVTNQAATAIVTEQITNNTSILQSAQQIIMSALEDYVKSSDFEGFQSSVQTTLSIMAGTIEANFTETTGELYELNGDMSQQFETIRSYIRMIASGIVIGESSSSIKLKLENNILYFFTGDEDSVSTENALAYFSSGKLYVNNVEVLTSLRVGPFSWVPESDNLNFKLMEA